MSDLLNFHGNYEEFEDCIVKVLNRPDSDGNPKNSLYKSVPMPDNEAELAKAYTMARVFVSSGQSDYEESEQSDFVIQRETMMFELEIRSASRRGDNGIYKIISDIQKQLIGYRFMGCERIQASKHGWVNGGPNNWYYYMSFSIRFKRVENQPQETGPTSTKITFN